MQVWGGGSGVTGIAHRTDDLTGFDVIVFLYIEALQMGKVIVADTFGVP